MQGKISSGLKIRAIKYRVKEGPEGEGEVVEVASSRICEILDSWTDGENYWLLLADLADHSVFRWRPDTFRGKSDTVLYSDERDYPYRTPAVYHEY